MVESIADIENAEELFDLLGETYHPATLRSHRIRILKRFGIEVTRLEETAPLLAEEARRHLYAAALRRIHDDCLNGNVTEPFLPARQPPLVTLRRPTRGKPG